MKHVCTGQDQYQQPGPPLGERFDLRMNRNSQEVPPNRRVVVVGSSTRRHGDNCQIRDPSQGEFQDPCIERGLTGDVGQSEERYEDIRGAARAGDVLESVRRRCWVGIPSRGVIAEVCKLGSARLGRPTERVSLPRSWLVTIGLTGVGYGRLYLL